MNEPRHVIFASYGNDSIALVQWAHENGLADLAVLYSDTGWGIEWWPARVERAEAWVRSLGYAAVRTRAEGFADLTRAKQIFARPRMQFCTQDLKIRPAMSWLDTADPDRRAVCFVGVRREESARRATFDEWQECSLAHGGRRMWAPLVDFNEARRDELILAAGFDVLPHRSKECFPCINSNRKDLRMLADYPERVDEIEQLEADLGTTPKGVQKTMFRSARYSGAWGIREVVRWAQSGRGEFEPEDSGAGPHCDGGYCGT